MNIKHLSEKVITILIVLLLAGCTGKNDTMDIAKPTSKPSLKNEFHENEKINELIVTYNEISEYKIDKAIIDSSSTNKKDRIFFSLGEIWVELFYNSTGLIIELSDETESNEELSVAFKDFFVAVVNVSSEEVDNVWEVLIAEEEYTLTDFGIKCTYFSGKLNNDTYRYSITISSSSY